MQCLHIKPDKSQCQSKAMKESNGYCYFHNPDITEEERKLVQMKGGQASSCVLPCPLPLVELKNTDDVVVLLEDTINRVRSGEMDVKVANCIGILSGQMIKAMELSKIANRVEVIERAILLKR